MVGLGLWCPSKFKVTANVKQPIAMFAIHGHGHSKYHPSASVRLTLSTWYGISHMWVEGSLFLS